MRTLFSRAVLAPLLLLMGMQAHAATWVLAQGESRVVFKYFYGSDPYEAEFKNVEATFEIDPTWIIFVQKVKVFSSLYCAAEGQLLL